jgi:hypothetical protein
VIWGILRSHGHSRPRVALPLPGVELEWDAPSLLSTAPSPLELGVLTCLPDQSEGSELA